MNHYVTEWGLRRNSMSEFIFTDKFKKLSLPFKTTFDRMQRRKKNLWYHDSPYRIITSI